jgi:hypothetical protein
MGLAGIQANAWPRVPVIGGGVPAEERMTPRLLAEPRGRFIVRQAQKPGAEFAGISITGCGTAASEAGEGSTGKVRRNQV